MLQKYGAKDGADLAQLVQRGEVHPHELLDDALASCARHNPRINAVTLIQEQVARRLIDKGLPKGPFCGVPFLLKDLGAEAVDFPSHSGSRLFYNSFDDQNSTIYDRMLATGLVPWGRTTTPEGGIGVATEAAVYGGPTRNPWNVNHTPGGSSGGAGAAVTAGIVPLAHGSDGGGSVRIPASNCGLFGFKPTRARLPDGPYAGESWAGMAIDGFLTRSVRDTALMLDACMGADLGAPYDAPPLGSSLCAAMQTPPRPLRIMLVNGTFEGGAIDPQVAEIVTKTARLLEEMGHIIIPAYPDADISQMMQAWTDIVAIGTALSIDSALQGRPLTDDLVEPLGRSAWHYAKTLAPTRYVQAVGQIHAFGRQMARAFAPPDRPHFDMILSATLAEPPAKIGRFAHDWDDYVAYRLGPKGIFTYSPFCAVFNASGQPAASVPMGMIDGLPIGIHLAAPFGKDDLLIALCAQLEQAAPWADRF